MVQQVQLLEDRSRWGFAFGKEWTPVYMGTGTETAGFRTTFRNYCLNGFTSLETCESGTRAHRRNMRLVEDTLNVDVYQKVEEYKKSVERANKNKKKKKKSNGFFNWGNPQEEALENDETVDVVENPKPVKKELEKNQIPNGTYIIGEDIPEGIYDFLVIEGEGDLSLYKSADNLDYENRIHQFSLSDKVDSKFYKTQCYRIVCKKGNCLVIGDTLVVEISKSPKLYFEL